MRGIRPALPTLLATLTFLAPWMMEAGTTPGSGLEGTPHDFVSSSTTEAIGLCTFCHTPHKSSSTKLLWNHALSTNSFSWDSQTTTAGTQYTSFQGDTFQGVSTRCLSCHDGSVAVGDVNWFGAAKPSPPLNSDLVVGDYQIGTDSGDMSQNHPIAMPYPFGNVANTYNGITTGNAAYFEEWQTDPESLGIRLFSDEGGINGSGIRAGAQPGITGIECSSCHDPHNKQAKDVFFLRGKLSGTGSDVENGYICLKCHVK